MSVMRDRFWKRVAIIPEHPCWEWTGHLNDQGYGKMMYESNRKKQVRAHRVSWELHYGPIPEGLHVLHKCDNRSCVRPEHLFIGTNNDNMKDRDAKGRHWQSRKTHCPKGHPYDIHTYYGVHKRRCSICRKAYNAEYHRRRKEADAS